MKRPAPGAEIEVRGKPKVRSYLAGAEAPPLQGSEVLGRRYRVECLIAAGTYARVYKAVDRDDGKAVALKVERTGNRQLLRSESEVLKHLQGRPGIPKFHAFVKSDPTVKSDFMVCELLGEDLAAALARVKRFSNAAAAHLGSQMLTGLQSVHAAGLVHRDVKPNNFVLGGTAHGNAVQVFVVDFGLAKKHLRRDGTVLQPRPGTEFRGTTRYASVAAHRKEELGRKDDLWSLLYSLLEMVVGALPWSFYRGGRANRMPAGERQEAKARVLEEKLRVTHAVRRGSRGTDSEDDGSRGMAFLRRVPGPLVDFLTAVDGLKYKSKPDYDFLGGILARLGEIPAESWDRAARDLLGPPRQHGTTVMAKLRPLELGWSTSDKGGRSSGARRRDARKPRGLTLGWSSDGRAGSSSARSAVPDKRSFEDSESSKGSHKLLGITAGLESRHQNGLVSCSPDAQMSMVEEIVNKLPGTPHVEFLDNATWAEEKLRQQALHAAEEEFTDDPDHPASDEVLDGSTSL